MMRDQQWLPASKVVTEVLPLHSERICVNMTTSEEKLKTTRSAKIAATRGCVSERVLCSASLHPKENS